MSWRLNSSNFGGFFDLPQKQAAAEGLQKQMADQNFWSHQDGANKVLRELKYLKSCIDPFEKNVAKVKELKELAEISSGEEEFLAQIQKEINELTREIAELETTSLLSGAFDRNNAILSINAGAGGTESCDWANMLLRMYTRWVEDKGYRSTIVDILAGEEAGIKNVMMRVEGDCAYGYLKGERGVHRLVRISPFDANKRRHTSFASVDVIAELADDIAVEIPPDDLRIDIYRASGPGGQGVNTTDSAVRLTHIPSGIVVQCQNERSQLQNKQTAMRILKARLYERKRKEQDDRMAKEYGVKQKIEWGSQIRSYVMQPYCLVKDHRTDVETGNVNAVMDGEIDLFIDAFLRWKPEKES